MPSMETDLARVGALVGKSAGGADLSASSETLAWSWWSKPWTASRLRSVSLSPAIWVRMTSKTSLKEGVALVSTSARLDIGTAQSAATSAPNKIKYFIISQ